MERWPHIHVKDISASGKSDACPKISIVTPSYNQGDFIEETILSVINQRYPNLEYLIIDGGSSDKTVEIIRKYEKHLNFWVSEPDNGQSDAICKGFEKCTGDLLLWLNSDDLLMPGALQIISSIWQQHPESVLITGQCHQLFDLKKIDYKAHNEKPNDPKLFKNALLHYQNPIRQPATFINRKAYESTRGLNNDHHYSMDYDLWVKLSSGDAKIVETEAYLAIFRLHDECKSIVASDRFLTENLAVAIRYLPDLAIISRVQRLAEFIIDQKKTSSTGLLSQLIERDLKETFPKEDLSITSEVMTEGIFLALKNNNSNWKLYTKLIRTCYQRPKLLFHLLKSISK